MRAFQVIFILVLGTEYWLRAVPRWDQLSEAYFWHLGIAFMLCIAALSVRLRRPAFAALALAHTVLVAREFPATGNHAYLEIVLCALGAVLDPTIPAERTLYLRAARALVLIVFFWSGVQKLVNGYWTNGLYLAFALRTPSYRAVLWPLVPAVELERLASLGVEVGSGPYTPAAPTLVAVSNATWMFEIALAPLLAWRRTRVVGALAAIALVAAIEVGAREVFFGLVFLDGLLLFLPPAVQRGAVVGVALMLAMLALVRLGVLPEATFY